jgi:hypothetical protein
VWHACLGCRKITNLWASAVWVSNRGMAAGLRPQTCCVAWHCNAQFTFITTSFAFTRCVSNVFFILLRLPKVRNDCPVLVVHQCFANDDICGQSSLCGLSFETKGRSETKSFRRSTQGEYTHDPLNMCTPPFGFF